MIKESNIIFTGLFQATLTEEFEALSINHIFGLNGGWNRLERIFLIPYEMCYKYIAENLLHLLITFFFQ